MEIIARKSAPALGKFRFIGLNKILLPGCILLCAGMSMPDAQRLSTAATTRPSHSTGSAHKPAPALPMAGLNSGSRSFARIAGLASPPSAMRTIAARLAPAAGSGVLPTFMRATSRVENSSQQPAARHAASAPVVVSVTAASAYVRAKPATYGTVLGAVFRGDKLTVLGRTNDGFWLRVDVPKFGTTTWIATSVGTVTGDLAKVPRIGNAAAAPAAAAASVPSALAQAPSVATGGMRIYPNLPYDQVAAANPRQSLDLYVPASSQKHGVIIYVHGGGWSGGDKSEVGQKGQAFTAAGYVFASVNYQLLPAGAHPNNVKDLAKAISWIQKHIERYGGNSKRLFLLGHSAGAQLAALVATDERYLAAESQPLSIIKGVVALDGGAYDIPLIMRHYTDRNNVYALAFGPKYSPVWDDASAVNHVAPAKNIAPFLIVHAHLNAFRKQQAVSLASSLKSAGVHADLLDIPDRTHSTLSDLLGSAGDRTTKAILEFYNSLN